ncbi:endonuclease III domain-containing protein [Candidatus Shapirobacteria bacterium]|nr:MAG: endonuclease III domain-containing protein [Candidatus Shapirobacteria bacterium]
MQERREELLSIYNSLYRRFGPQHWWPGDSPLEISIGAILTQNTAWRNVERAIENLKREGLLSVKGLEKVSMEKLRAAIRPAGYFNEKAKKIKAFIDFLFANYQGSLRKMFKEEREILRKKLLQIRGIGKETADSILLYAGNLPVFVVDAYTRRILSRHNLVSEKADYEEIQRLFMDNLPLEAKLFNEFHALFVRLGKEICKKKDPDCVHCPLRRFSVSTSSENKEHFPRQT